MIDTHQIGETRNGERKLVELFRQLLQGVYADRLLAYTDQKVVFDKEKMLKKGRAEVQSNIVLSDGKKVPIFYRLTNKSGQVTEVRSQRTKERKGKRKFSVCARKNLPASRKRQNAGFKTLNRPEILDTLWPEQSGGLIYVNHEHKGESRKDHELIEMIAVCSTHCCG